MSDSWENSKYQVLSVSTVEMPSEGRKWYVMLGIRRPWPLSWIDHRPWETRARRPYPVKTFIGSGCAWFQFRDGKAFGVAGLTPLLNAIASKEALSPMKHISSTPPNGVDDL